MEINTSMVKCANGHSFDGLTSPVCPICGAPPTSAPAAGGGFPHTEAVGGTSAPVGNFIETVDPYVDDSIPNPYPGGQTIPAGRDNHTAIPDPFSIPTQIGGDYAPIGPQTSPVVGWLVCIDGPTRGVDYRIHAGYNYIGRDQGDIHIKGDMQVSRQNHAMVAFDSLDNTFFAGPAAGTNLVRLNGKTIFAPVELHQNDILTIGTTRLIFVPLCGEAFSWGKES